MDAPVHLSVAIVTYRTDAALVDRCIAALARSAAKARADGRLGEAGLYLIDNSPDAPAFDGALRAWGRLGEAHVLAGHGNLGYAKANNLVLDRLRSDVHLVMNPDVEVDDDAVGAALAALGEHPAI